jgi:uncharacterized membrane protein
MLGEIYDVIFYVLGFFCHQLPERSLVIFGAQFPLCIRCSALLMGAGGALAYLLMRLPLPSVKLCLIMTLPTAVEIAGTSWGLAGSGNLVRGINGLLSGFFFLLGSMVWLAGRERGATSPLRQSSPGLEAS